MFPRLRQRVLIVLTIVVGVTGFWAVRPVTAAIHGDDGLLLIRSAAGPGLAGAAMVVAGLPCVVLGVVTAVRGNPLSGIFGMAAALVVTAWRRGPIDDWLRSADLPTAYNGLMLELIGWQAALVAVLLLVQKLRAPMRQRVPALAFHDHLGMDTNMTIPQSASLLAGVLCAAIAGVLGFVLIRTADVGQVLLGLLLAFMVGAMVAHLIVRHDNPVGILFSPALVAVFAYTWMVMRYDTNREVIEAWYDGRVLGLALALPVHYTGAAVAGCTIGLGWAEAMMAGERERPIEQSPG